MAVVNTNISANAQSAMARNDRGLSQPWSVSQPVSASTQQVTMQRVWLSRMTTQVMGLNAAMVTLTTASACSTLQRVPD